METFRLTHISDLHLGSIPQMRGLQHRARAWSFIADALRQSVSQSFDITSLTGTYDAMAYGSLLNSLRLNEMDPGGTGVDAILLSGDVCSVGLLREFESARRSLFEGNNEARVKLPVDKLIVMPGNHDRYFGFPLMSGSKDFEDERAFTDRWSPSNEPAIHPTAVRERRIKSKTRGAGGLSVICADFSLSLAQSTARLPTLYRHLNDGYVDDATLHSLVTCTTSAQEQGFAVVWAIHYPPKFPTHRIQQLFGYKKVLREARALDVRHIFAGHTHRQVTYVAGKDFGVQIHCAGSPSSDGSEHFDFMRHRIRVLGEEVQHVDTNEYRLNRDTTPQSNEKFGVFVRRRRL